MPRPCLVCSDSAKMARAAEMITAGASDNTIAKTLSAMTPDRPPMSGVSVGRHRRNHVVAPAKAIAEAAGKGRDAMEQRAQTLAAAEAGDPLAFVALANIVADLRRVHERLERVADGAEQDGQRLAVAGLAAQQLRAAEVRAKLGNAGAYGAAARGAGEGEKATFTFILNMPGQMPQKIIEAQLDPDGALAALPHPAGT